MRSRADTQGDIPSTQSYVGPWSFISSLTCSHLRERCRFQGIEKEMTRCCLPRSVNSQSFVVGPVNNRTAARPEPRIPPNTAYSAFTKPPSQPIIPRALVNLRHDFVRIPRSLTHIGTKGQLGWHVRGVHTKMTSLVYLARVCHIIA